jgi:hydroxymethylpyrimidine/phosphomethylpyrimidine kinase
VGRGIGERRVVTAIVCSIGTTHPWNVAGVGRDIVVGTSLQTRVFSAVAAVSAQDRRGVVALHAVPDSVLTSQLAALPWDSAGAARVGALPNEAAVRNVAEELKRRPWLLAVVDPVFSASRGGELGNEPARAAIRDELATLANVILTPNLAEAAWLLGLSQIQRPSIAEAAQALRARGPAAVLVKGGHLAGEPTDALATADGITMLGESRIGGSMPGAGCTLAMALACALAAGSSLLEAVRSARAYVRAELARH